MLTLISYYIQFIQYNIT